MKAAIAPIRKPANTTRLTLADLKRRVAALEQENKQMAALLSNVPQPAPAQEPAKAKGWISGKGILSMCRKLGLSQEAFAKLVMVPNMPNIIQSPLIDIKRLNGADHAMNRLVWRLPGALLPWGSPFRWSSPLVSGILR